MMQQSVRKGVLALAGVLAVVIPLSAACSSGVPQTEYDAVKQQLAAQEKKVAEVQQQLADRDKQGAGQKSAVPIAGAVLNAPPRPTPTATPPGFVAPPPPALVAAEVKALVLDVDTVFSGPGESRYNVDPDKYCALSSTFKRGMHLVWLMEGYEASSGKELQPADVKEAVVKLPHGETINFRYGRHGATEGSPWFWSAAWDIPLDYPLGVLDYEVAVGTNTDKRGTFKPWGAHAPERNTTNRLTIIE